MVVLVPAQLMEILVDLVEVLHIVVMAVVKEFHNNQHQTLVLPNMDMLVVMERIEVLAAVVVLVVLVEVEVQEIQLLLEEMVELEYNYHQHLEIPIQQ
tara:strand:- start:41 stop:334 length:294 start_codon:yes stop_codon:yes gene_type:complete